MAKVKIQGHASGTGILTVTAPNTSTDRTITLPDETGTLSVGSSIDDNGNATAMTIGADENIGVGVVPEAWHSSGVALQVGAGGAIHAHTTDERIALISNAYEAAADGNWYHNVSGLSSKITLDNGAMLFQTAATGNADAAVTWATVMNIDSDGIITKPLQPAFQATSTSNQSNIAINTAVTVVFGGETFDIGSNFTSNTFTAPVTGKYSLTANMRIDNIDDSAAYYYLEIKTSNREYRSLFDPDFTKDMSYWQQHYTITADMDASDTAYVVIYQNTGNAQADIDGDAKYTNFSGHLVC